MRKILGATIGVCGVLAATLVLTLAMTAQTMDNDESSQAQMQVTATSNPTTTAQANPMKTDDGEATALMIVRDDQAVSTEVGTLAIFMGDEDNSGLLKGPVVLFMTDEASGAVTEVDNPTNGNMVGFIHNPTADNPDVAFIHSPTTTTPAGAQGTTNGV